MSRPIIQTCRIGEPSRIGKVSISLISAEEIERLSVVEVTDSSVSDKNMAKANGVDDFRMGSVDRRVKCGSCGRKLDDCPGHIGHIPLKHPLYHVSFMATVLKILKCVCYSCRRCLTYEEPKGEGDTVRKVSKTKLAKMASKPKSSKLCPFCDSPQPKYSIPTDSPLKIRAQWDPSKFTDPKEAELLMSRPLNQRDVYNILWKIPDEHYRYMGFDPTLSHPSNMIQRVIPVPSPLLRPSRTESEGSRSKGQDDLTQKLKKMVALNQSLGKHYVKREEERASRASTDADTIISDYYQYDPIEEALVDKLQYEYATYLNNNIRGVKADTLRSGAPMKYLFLRLKGKDGRVRGNLMGKRVDFTARAVTTPDPTLDVHEVGLPVDIALVGTWPERVTNFNYRALLERVRIGPSSIDGAKRIIDLDGIVTHLKHTSPLPRGKEPRLGIGWTVERPLKDGDPIIVNRQPSLHIGSMMGHRVKIIRTGQTIRLPLEVTIPYAADFGT